MKYLFFPCILVLSLWSCKSRDTGTLPVVEDEGEMMAWKENDSLRLASIPLGLGSWLGYYGSVDQGFRLANFKASGVVLHFNALPDPEAGNNEDAMKDYYIYSPDSTRYIDLFSYDHFMDKGVPVEGEADQQVIIADPGRNRMKQLFFVGPSQSADFADWLTHDVFILGMTSRSEEGGLLDAQLLVFSLTDSTFTNFNLDHSFSVDPAKGGRRGFTEGYMDKLRKQ